MCETLPKMTFLSKKFSLNWNDFQQNIISSIHDWRKDSDFCDVTLVCGEDQQIEAHKIILTACSPFFSSILKRNKHSHPIIYMRGLRAKDLVSLVDFIYHGEANIYQEDLAGFLALAEELQLKGLEGDKTLDTDQEQIKDTKLSKSQRKHIHGPEEYPDKSKTHEENYTKIINTYEDCLTIPVDAGNLVLPLDTNKEGLEAWLDTMMAKAEDGAIQFSCNVCGKTAKGNGWAIVKRNMRQHIETHIEGLSYPCNKCGKVCRTSHRLSDHARRYHGNKG